MGNRSRRRHIAQLPAATPQVPSALPPAIAPEQSLLDAIVAGELDEHLGALADAIHARRHLLHTVRAATALAALCVGDEVQINHRARPRYLQGVQGIISELDERTATIRVHRAVGRFTSGEIRCPPLALDRLGRTPAGATAERGQQR